MLQNFKCSKARLYVATKGSKKLACDVREETGADLVCNAALVAAERLTADEYQEITGEVYTEG